MYFPKPICCWYDMIWYDRVDSCCDGCGLLLSLHWFGKKSVYGCWFSCTYSAFSKRVASSSFTGTTCVLHALFLCVCVFFWLYFFSSHWSDKLSKCFKVPALHSHYKERSIQFCVCKHLAFFSPQVTHFFQLDIDASGILHLQILSYILLLLSLFWWLFRCLGDCFES